MRELIERLESVECGSRELDALIEDVFFPLEPDEDGHRTHTDFIDYAEFEDAVPHYTGSVDAALNLAELLKLDVPQLLNDALDGPGGLWARGYQAESFACQIALALCAEILRTTEQHSPVEEKD